MLRVIVLLKYVGLSLEKLLRAGSQFVIKNPLKDLGVHNACNMVKPAHPMGAKTTPDHNL
jgi:hypothetical protein